ncbi:MAG: GGDEF domain-containing protein [Gammaproteobacteria bacterium]|nr:GGDEF domain-containing protein [Gammaproteobacteria bacterium]
MDTVIRLNIATDLLEILPNPVLVKNDSLEYIFVNRAFETLFGVSRKDVKGRLDAELFPDRQVAQCNGGDLTVLETGIINESAETVIDSAGAQRETITRKSRLETVDGSVYLVGIMHDITEVSAANEALKKSQAKLEEQAVALRKLATTDSMTGCKNRLALINESKDWLDNVFSPVSLLLIDLDNFKKINDTYGHDLGDLTLVDFANHVSQLLQPQDLFARIGGEEFVVMLNDSDAEDAFELAERLRKMIEGSEVKQNDICLNYTISTGVSVKESGQSTTIAAMLTEADKRLYKAKKNGRNTVVMAA